MANAVMDLVLFDEVSLLVLAANLKPSMLAESYRDNCSIHWHEASIEQLPAAKLLQPTLHVFLVPM